MTAAADRTVRGRRLVVLLAVALLAVAAVVATLLHALPPAQADSAERRTGTAPAAVSLAPIVQSWGAGYTVVGQKSEPLYTERISSTRDGDVFAVRIEAIAQGDAPLGVQESAVRVDADGTVEWLAGCTAGASCADDPAVRGFLSGATVLSMERQGRLPATATQRMLHSVAVLCLPDAALHPDAPPAVSDLQPCFSRQTGALLGHYSPASEAFVGPTLASGFEVTPAPDRRLIASIVPGSGA